MPGLFRSICANAHTSHGQTLYRRSVGGMFTGLRPSISAPTLQYARRLFALVFLLHNLPFISLTCLQGSSLHSGIVACHEHGAKHALSIALAPRTVVLIRGCVGHSVSSPCLFSLLGDHRKAGRTCQRCRLTLHAFGQRLVLLNRLLKLNSGLDSCDTHRA